VHRLAVHFSLWVFNNSIFTALTNGALFQIASSSGDRMLGALPLGFRIPATILLFDLFGYALHRTLHASPMLWKIHSVHHSDERVDATTALRSHLFQVFFTGLCDMALLLFFSPGLTAYLCYWACLQTSLFFHHSRLTFSEKTIDSVGKIFVLPSHHHLHHEKRERAHLGNFANIFSFWDRLFGTQAISSSKDFPMGLFGSLVPPLSLSALLAIKVEETR
jgi:sterol desaturase/sphingolipid hydroxylase (fatty acid hydroxylase superfamily)